jgi:biotin carboxyl carrier protein
VKLQVVIDGQAYEVEVDLGSEAPLTQLPGTATIHSTVVPTAASAAAFSDSELDEHKLCRSPVNGIVVVVTTEPGKPVNVGDTLMVLEAMKMETKVTAPVSSIIKAVKVTAGEAVKLNQILVEFE